MSFISKKFTQLNNFLNKTLGEFLYEENKYKYQINDINNFLNGNNGVNTHYIVHKYGQYGEYYGLHYVLRPYHK